MTLNPHLARPRFSAFVPSPWATLAGTCSALLVTGLLASTPAIADAQPTTDPYRLVHQGVAVELELESLGQEPALREGTPAAVRFRITDTHTETPLSGVFPAAWMDRLPARGEGLVESEVGSCQDKVEAFIAGSLLAPPELDLNVYYVLALNDDATLSVVDPLFGFGGTKLLDMVFLEAPGEDWVLTPEQDVLYVSMPSADAVAVVDTHTWSVDHNLPVAGAPGRLLLDTVAGRLWVAREGGVDVLDTARGETLQRVELGPAPHRLVADRDLHRVYVADGAGGLAVVDARSFEVLARHQLPANPTGLAYSSLADAAYALTSDGTLTVVDGSEATVRSRITIGEGTSSIAFAPGERLAFVTRPEVDEVHIIDAALDRVIQTADVEAGPDQVAFSDHLAYVRHRDSEIVLMIPLDQIGVEGRPIPVIDFPGGHEPFGAGRSSAAASIVQAPGATAVLVANPADRAIYFYKEGMAAPMGHFQNYGRQPRAVLAVDRSLQEGEPGVYGTTAILRRPGTYDLAFFLDSPRTIHCFRVEIEANPERSAGPVGRPTLLEATDPEGHLTVGQTSRFRFRLVDGSSGEARGGATTDDAVRVVSFRAPGLDQRRQWAQPVAPGLFEVELEPTATGVYFVFVDAPELGLTLGGGQYLVIDAREEGS